MLKDECPVNALRAQNLAGGHFSGPYLWWGRGAMAPLKYAQE